MQLLSFNFLVLFTLCFILYYALKDRFRNALLLVVSFVFIGWYHLPFLLTAIAVALYTFCGSVFESCLRHVFFHIHSSGSFSGFQGE